MGFILTINAWKIHNGHILRISLNVDRWGSVKFEVNVKKDTVESVSVVYFISSSLGGIFNGIMLPKFGLYINKALSINLKVKLKA